MWDGGQTAVSLAFLPAIHENYLKLNGKNAHPVAATSCSHTFSATLHW
ncbi:hypothetical protein DESC_590170 [Desulfosarcina cetonica]|nr:hypothetical protein DESC_590170 [Desulfosarcina cetonica]